MKEFNPQSWVENAIFSTVLMNLTYSDNSEGTGSGFFYSYKTSNGKEIYFIISNRHIIEKSVRGNIQFQTRKGKTIVMEITGFERFWIMHPDDDIDMAALLINQNILEHLVKLGSDEVLSHIPYNEFPSEKDLYDLVDAEEKVYFVKYPKIFKDETPIYINWNTEVYKYNLIDDLIQWILKENLEKKDISPNPRIHIRDPSQ